MDPVIFLIQVLNGVQYGLLLFLVASGLTLIFGIMGIINLAHGSFYMIGAYLAFSLTQQVGNFWAALTLGVVVAVVRGLERVELRNEAADAAELGELSREDPVDARRRRLGPERPQPLREEPRMVRLALRDDQVAGAQHRIVLVLGPLRVERGAPGFERAEDVQSVEHRGAVVRHAPIVARPAALG